MSEENEVLDASTEPDFLDSIPEDLRTESSFADINNVQDLARSYHNAQKMVGADKVAIPGPNAEDSDWGVVYDRLGRPEDSKSYEFTFGEEQGSIASDDAVIEQFKETAYGIGLSKKQAEGIFNWYNGLAVESSQQIETGLSDRRRDAEEALQKEFGNAYNQRLELAQRIAREFGGDEGVQLLEETGLGNDPTVIKMFAKIGMAMSEDNIAVGTGNSSFLMTPNEAQREIASLQRDNEFMKAYGDASAPTHPEAVTRMQKLFQYAHPELVDA